MCYDLSVPAPAGLSSLLRVALVGVHARGFFHATEKWRLVVCLVYCLYISACSRLKQVVSKRLERTVVNRAIYCPALSSSTPRLSISFLIASFKDSISAAASSASACHSFRDSILEMISVLDIVCTSFLCWWVVLFPWCIYNISVN